MPAAGSKGTTGDAIAMAPPKEVEEGSSSKVADSSDSQGAGVETVDSAPAESQARRRKRGPLAKILHRKDTDGEGAQLDRKTTKSSSKHKKSNFSVASQIRSTILNSWINLLLIAVPIGIAVNFVPSINRLVVFVVNFIAIIPLAAMLSYATEEIALHVGEVLGGLLNATFGYSYAGQTILALRKLTFPETLSS